MKLCCSHCFLDAILKERIKYEQSSIGKCDYCYTEDQCLIDPQMLVEYLRLVTSIYRESKDGKSLVELLKTDWAIFNNSLLSDHCIQVLLSDILNDGQYVRKNFILSEKCQTEKLSQWENLRNELMFQNRYFPKTQINTQCLKDLFDHLIFPLIENSQTWYRARIQPPGIFFSIEEMGCPPHRLTSHGRATPAGIPYLYLGSEIDTVISEVRPHPGEQICVATFSVKKNLKIADLRNPRKIISPFTMASEEDISSLRGDIAFLETLGQELAIPVIPSLAAIDYIPSQYLCELIKHFGFHGVIYKSSVSSGMNLALFDESNASPKVDSICTYNVSSVKVEFKK